MIQPGTYKARVSEWGLTTAQNDAEQMCIVFDLAGHPGEPSPPLFCSFTDAALELSVRWLRACGWEGDNPATATLDKKRVVLVTIAEETYEGKKRMRVVNVGDSPIVRFAMGTDRAKSFGSRIAQRIALLEGRDSVRRDEPDPEPGANG